MAGQGFKDFAVGEVLTAADVDGYLMQQSVMRFADSAARGSALGTAVGTAVPLAEGMVTYLDDVNQVQVFDGTAWAATGRVLQVVSTTKTDTFSTTSTSFVDVTGLTVTITPGSASNKVLLFYSVTGAYSDATDTDYGMLLAPYRGATNLIVPTSPSARTASQIFWNGRSLQQFARHGLLFSGHILDSPATTSSTTYSVRVAVSVGGTAFVNRSDTDLDTASFLRSVSTITAIEVTA